MKFRFFIWIPFLSLLFTSCAQINALLQKIPSRSSGQVGVATEKEEEKTILKDPRLDVEKVKPGIKKSNIALVLPFQLNRISEPFTEADIKRSSLALDFYQGFQLGLKKSITEQNHIALELLDSQDDEVKSKELSQSQAVKRASLIIGPIYPQEIKSFGNSSGQVLKINPLAATMPTEFNQSNLVSITPPISVHMRAISSQVAKNYHSKDVIIIYNTMNSDHQQFISGFSDDIKARLTDGGRLVSVSTISQLGDYLAKNAVSHIITGTTDRAQLRTLMERLDERFQNGDYEFRLYGHPLWDKIDFSSFQNFAAFKPIISAESHLDIRSVSARNFQGLYKENFGIEPSEHAYKGFDLGVYFGMLLEKYGDDYAKHITEETFSGVYSNYKFNQNNQWGYVNYGLNFKIYTGGSFQLF